MYKFISSVYVMIFYFLSHDFVHLLQIRRAISSARRSLSTSFVPKYLGFNHMTRETVINNHTRPLAKELLTPGTSLDDKAILVLDGTYVYVKKSADFEFHIACTSIDL